MNELLSTLIVSIYAAAAALGGSTASRTDAEAKVEQLGGAEMRTDARIYFKRIETQSNAVYKAAIADCKKKPSAEKQACVEEARAVNDKEIFAAKASLDKTMAEAHGVGGQTTLEATADSGVPDTLGVRFLPDSASAHVFRALKRVDQ